MVNLHLFLLMVFFRKAINPVVPGILKFWTHNTYIFNWHFFQFFFVMHLRLQYKDQKYFSLYMRLPCIRVRSQYTGGLCRLHWSPCIKECRDVASTQEESSDVFNNPLIKELITSNGIEQFSYCILGFAFILCGSWFLGCNTEFSLNLYLALNLLWACLKNHKCQDSGFSRQAATGWSFVVLVEKGLSNMYNKRILSWVLLSELGIKLSKRNWVLHLTIDSFCPS